MNVFWECLWTPDLPFAKIGDISEELQVVCEVRHLFPKAVPALPQSALFGHLSINSLTPISVRLLGMLGPRSPLEPSLWHYISHLPVPQQ